MKNLILPLLLIAALVLAAAGDKQKTTVKSRPAPKVMGSPVIPGQISVKFNQGIVPGKTSGGQVSFGIGSLDEKAAQFEVSRAAQRFRQLPLPEKPGLPDLSRIYRITFPEKYHPLEVARAFSADPNVEYATPHYIPEYDAVPNDPMYNLQFHLPQIMAEEAWEIHKGQDGDQEVVIAIIDCGVDWRHPDLKQNVWQNLAEDADGDGHTIEWVGWQWDLDPGDLNGFDDDWNGYPDDLIGWDFYAWDVIGDGSDPNPLSVTDWHGTHVAGIAAARTDNNTGVASVSWNVKYLPTQTDYGELVSSYYSFEGIVYAAQQGADVINCSFSHNTYSPDEAEVIEYANGLGSVIICSAGNTNINEVRYPCGYLGAIATASVKSSDQKATYSTFGINVDIAAPGGDWEEGIWSTITGNTYEGPEWFGTSMASPLAAGVAALIKSYHPDWSREQVIYQLMGSCDNIDGLNPGYEFSLGAGRINAYRALTDTNLSVPQYLKLGLHNYEAVDKDGDGMLSPGDTVNLDVTLWNHAAFAGCENAIISLHTDDPDVTMISITDVNCDIPPEALFQLDDIFRFRLSENCPPHWVEFLITVEADLPVVFGDSIPFHVLVAPGGIFVFEPEEGRYDYSGTYIKIFLENIDQEILYSNYYPNSFEGFDAVFLSLGNIGPNNNKAFIPDYEQSMTFCDYAMQGGKLYVEMGGFFIGAEYLQYPNAALVRELFGVADFAFHLDDNPVDTLSGLQGTPYEGMRFTRSTQHFNQYIDDLFAAPGAYCTFHENDYGDVGINNEGEYGQKTSYLGYALAELEDVDAHSSRCNFLLQTMEFFGYQPGPGYVIANFTCGVRGGAAGEAIHFRDISLTAEGSPVINWQWDFQNDGIIDSQEQDPEFAYSGGGLYDVRLIASNGIVSDTLIYPGFIRINEGILVYEGNPGANDFSGEFIRDFLLENNYGATYMVGNFPATFSGYDAIFLSLGNFGGFHMTQLDDILTEMIIDYLQQGGNVYLEGAEALGADQAGNIELLTAFGLESVDNGTVSNFIDMLAGQEGSIMEGLEFNASSEAAPAYIDIYTPTEDGIAAFEESDYGIVGVQNEFATPSGNAKTFCFTYTLSGLDQDEEPNTREEVLWRLLDFFGLITGVDEPAVGGQRSAVSVYPNPTDGIVDFRWSMVDGRWVSLKIYEVHGREVATVVDGMWYGDKVIRWDASGLPAGVYVYQLRAKGIEQGAVGKIVKY